MSRRLYIALALAAAVLAMLALPATSSAAKRKVPFGFFGAVLPPDMISPQGTSDAALEQQAALMAGSGVESVRIVFDWRVLEPSPGSYSFGDVDRLVGAMARHRISVLASVTGSPQWISQRPNVNAWWSYPPRDPTRYADLMRQLVLRYGPTGSFWAQNPSIPHNPVRRWQLWNEQTAPWHWARRPWAPGYTQLLKESYRAIHRVDRGATVVAGSLVAALKTPWAEIRALYRAGAKRYFDEIAIHPFTRNRTVRGTTSQVLEIVRRVRKQMRRRGDGRKPIILTEVTWPASAGKVPRRARIGFETTARGQRARFRSAFSRFAKERRRLRITQAYWYTWASEYDAKGPTSVMTFRFSGLTRLRGGVFTAMPLLRAYSRLAARYEGCRKGADARTCG